MESPCCVWEWLKNRLYFEIMWCERIFAWLLENKLEWSQAQNCQEKPDDFAHSIMNKIYLQKKMPLGLGKGLKKPKGTKEFYGNVKPM